MNAGVAVSGHEARESWLRAVLAALRLRLESIGWLVPLAIRVACGWPAGLDQPEVLGACYATEVSSDGHFEIFVSPVVSEPAEVAGILAHEVAHAVCGITEGHGKRFAEVVSDLGLIGKPTNTENGPEFLSWWATVAPQVGAYPHGAMVLGVAPTQPPPTDPVAGGAPAPSPKKRAPTRIGGPKPQTSRLLRVACPGCGYVVRVTRVWLDKGAPICPTCKVSMVP